MGPNSGGGKRNQGKGNSNVATRARFSKAPKKLLDNIKKKGIDREVRKHVDTKQSTGRGSGGSRGTIQNIPLDKKRVEQKGLERLNLPQALLSKLLLLFEGPRPEEKAPTVRVPQPISKTSLPTDTTQDADTAPKTMKKTSDNNIALQKKENLPFSLSATPVNQHTKQSKAPPRGQALQAIFCKYGFTGNEIKAIVKNDKCSSDNEQFLALLVTSREHSFPTPAEVSKSSLPAQNDDLNCEIEVLTSIYGSGVFHENFQAFGFLPCCRISVLIEINDVNFEIRMFISNSDQYPNKNSKLYGWLIDPVAISLSKTVGVTHAACMSAESMRQVSLDAMEKIQYHHVQVEAPVAFDFVQSLNETVPEHIAMLKTGATTTTTKRNGASIGLKKSGTPAKLPQKKESSSNTKGDEKKAVTATAGKAGTSSQGKGQKSSKGKKQSQEEVAAVEEPFPKRPKLPPMPVTFLIKSAEYRTAYDAGLSKGLARSAAQALALEELEYVMPASDLKNLRKEIAYNEAKMDMSFSITKNMSMKETIEGTRILSEQLNVNKAAGKALYLEAKEGLLTSGDEYARTESLLKKKIIDCALDIQKQRIEKKEEKKKEKDKQKQLELSQTSDSGIPKESIKGRTSDRGLTIRDAYKVVDATKKQRAKQDGLEENAYIMDDDVDLQSLDIDDDGAGAGVNVDVDNRDVRSTATATTTATAVRRGTGGAAKDVDVKVLKSSYGKSSQAEALMARQQTTAPPVKSAKTEGAPSRSNEELELESRRLRNLLNNKKCMAGYKEWFKKRGRLPAFQMKSDILHAIDSNSVVVISGDTGCGKTTQIPQLVLDDFIERGCGAMCNIIVTQPRRISAVSVAEQIARERVEKVGLSVGYHIRLETVKSASTRLLLMTTGVLLRKLQADDCNLEGVSHIFVDEVHERDINTDFLLIVLKKMLLINPHIKIILMSATLNANLFIDYFHNSTSPDESISCTLISIPGRAFPVNDFYLEDVLEQTKHEIVASSDYAIKAPKKATGKQDKSKGQDRDMDEKDYRKTLLERNLKEQHIATLRKLKKYSDKTLNSLMIADESIINLDLIQKLVMHILTLDNTVVSGDNVGAILIFVPGLADIRNVIDCLNERPEISNPGANVRVFPLHSSLTSQEQSRVFQILPNRGRKIIVSTNIAETSVTIEDVVFVIDTCRVKENSYDDESQMNVLQEEFISQANARQRRGRAGRVRSGVCFHLVSQYTLQNLPAFTTPEMLRMSLEDLILQVLALDLGDPYVFLGEALSPPDQSSVTNALLFLESLSAVNLLGDQIMSNSSAAKIKKCLPSEITPLGFHLAALPISPRLGKLLLYGVLLKCIDPVLTIIATVSAKSPFVSSFENRTAADLAKQQFLCGNSDLLSAMNAFDSWKTLFGGRRSKDEEFFCKTNFLSGNSLKLIEQMRGQFLDLLKGIGFMSQSVNIRNVKESDENSNGSNIEIIKCALCAGLSPNILLIPPSVRDPKKGGTLSKKLMEASLSSCRKGISLSVHPSSIMSDSKQLDSSFVAYLEAMKTAKVYARDVTTISPITLALFCGKMSANLPAGVVVVNGWLTFAAVPDIARCLTYVREEIEEAFIEKVIHPDSPQSDIWNKVLDIIKQI